MAAKKSPRKTDIVEVPLVVDTVDAAPAQSASPPPAAKSDGVVMLTRDELTKLRVAELEHRLAKAEAEAQRMKKKWLLALLDPKGHVDATEKEQEKALGKAKEAAKKYELARAHVSMRLNIDLSTCGFDPDTGVVVFDNSSKK